MSNSHLDFIPIIECEICSDFPREDARYDAHPAEYSLNLMDADGTQNDPYHICGKRLGEVVQGTWSTVGIAELHISKLDQ